MYSLDCSYFEREFKSIQDLLENILTSGMDPNYEITFNGEGTGEIAFDLIEI